MEIMLLGIYSFFVWLVFFKFKWLPWNIVTQVIVVTIPMVGLTMLILLLNIVAPSSHDVRVVNYVVPINPPVRGLVTEVPIEPNRPIKKGDVLFKVDPTPFEIEVRNSRRKLAQLRVQLLTAGTSSRNLQEQLKGATGQKEALESTIETGPAPRATVQGTCRHGRRQQIRLRAGQAEVQNLEGQLASISATEAQARANTGRHRPRKASRIEIAKVKAQIAAAEAQIGQCEMGTQPDHLSCAGQWHGRRTDVAARRHGRSAADGPRHELRRGRAMDSRHFPPKRSSQDQAGPGGRDRLQDVSGPAS